MANPNVPHWKNLNEWAINITSMFGDVRKYDCGGFDADLSKEPPFVPIDELPKDLCDCFVFNTIAVYGNSRIECSLKLIEAIEKAIDNDMTEPRNTRKATIVWRVFPEVKYYHQEYKWRGYCRVRVVDKNSKREDCFKV